MPADWSNPFALVAILVTGLFAGTLGGMLGVGGSVIMIPALTLLLGYNQHLYQAAAMIANIAVSVPATLRNRKAGVLNGDVLVWMLPAAALFVLAGVWVSNWPIFEGPAGGIWLGRVLAAFLLYVMAVNIVRLSDAAQQRELTQEPLITPARAGGIGAFMGLLGGLLGIGGGAVAVPLQQVLMRLPLKQCIGHSSAIICISALVGSAYKNATLAQHHVSPWHGLLLGLLLTPTCWLGGLLGASLLHRLPLRPVRLAFILLMLISAWKMAAIPWRELF